MRNFTTPTFTITVKKKVGIDDNGALILEPATDFVFDYLIFSIKSIGKRIDKRVEYSDYIDGQFKVRFTQEETGTLKGTAEAEINFMRGNTRIATCIQTIDVEKNLINEVIGDDESE